MAENCKELVGLIQMFAADAESPRDRMLLAGTCIGAAIRLYLKADMSYEEIAEVLECAVPEFKNANPPAKKTKKK
jgi:hypothetical protein